MHLKQNLFFSLLKSKNWRETQSFLGFPLHRSKTVLSIFGNFYNTVYESTFNFQFSWRLFFDVKGRILQIFQKKFIWRSLPFLEMKTLPRVWRELAWRNLPIFWKLPPKNIPDQQKHIAFQKLQKVLNHYTLLCTFYTVHMRLSS